MLIVWCDNGLEWWCYEKRCCDFGIKISDIEMDLENQNLISDSNFENEKWFLILN